MENARTLIVAALFVGMAAACGDGGGRSPGEDADSLGEVDLDGLDVADFDPNERIPPAIVAVSPERDAVSVPIRSVVTVEFDELVRLETVTSPGAFALDGPSTVEATVTLVGKLATLEPQGLLEPGTSYEASMSSLVMDLAGNHLGETYHWAFTTVADLAPPTPGVLRVGEVTDSSVLLAWDPAVDDAYPADTLSYDVFSSLADNIGLLDEVDTNGTPVGQEVGGTAIVATGLDPETTYYFNVVVADGKRQRAAYAMVEARTASPCDGFGCPQGSHCKLDEGLSPFCTCNAGYRGVDCAEVTGWFGLGGSDQGAWENYLIPDGTIGRAVPGQTAHLQVATSAAGDVWVAWPTHLLHWNGASWERVTDQGAVTLQGAVAVLPGADRPLRLMWYGSHWGGDDYGAFATALGPTGEVFNVSAPPGVFVTSTDGTNVTDFGNAFSGILGTVNWVSIAVDSQNRPVVAYETESGTGLVSHRVRVTRWDGAQWVQLHGGNSIGDLTTLYQPELAIDRTDAPWVSYHDHRGAGGVTVVVAQFDETGWLSAGSAASGWHSNLAIDAADTVYSAFASGLRWWDGASWQSLSTRRAISQQPALSVMGGDQLLVAYLDSEGGNTNDVNVELRTPQGLVTLPAGTPPVDGGLTPGSIVPNAPFVAIDGATTLVLYGADDDAVRGALFVDERWSPVDTLRLEDALASGPEPKFAHTDGVPVVYWVSSTTSHLSRWVDGAWETVDHPPHQPGQTALAIGPGGAPVVAWSDSGTATVTIERLEGSVWTAVSSASDVSTPLSQAPRALALAADAAGRMNLVVTAGGDYLDVWSHDGSSWSQTAIESQRTVRAGRFALAQDSTGAPMVAWYTGATSGVGVVRYVAGAWQPAAGTVQSLGTGYIGDGLTLTVTDDDQPCVAWSALVLDDTQLYAKRWDGAQWAEIRGSGTGGGISNSFAVSRLASVSMRDGRICAAWLEGLESDDVLARCAWLP